MILLLISFPFLVSLWLTLFFPYEPIFLFYGVLTTLSLPILLSDLDVMLEWEFPLALLALLFRVASLSACWLLLLHVIGQLSLVKFFSLY